MAKARKADVFAKKGGFLDRLRKRRIAIESGDPTGGRRVAGFSPEMPVVVENNKKK